MSASKMKRTTTARPATSCGEQRYNKLAMINIAQNEQGAANRKAVRLRLTAGGDCDSRDE
jgi:hypothetical protein